MLKKTIHGLNLRFRHENRFKVIFSLIVNYFLEKYWRTKKKILRIKKPVVHLYAVCWNEEKIIPFFFSHYDHFVSHYYIYDNYSTDNTRKLLSTHKNLDIISYDTGNTFNDVVHQKIKNSAWKRSRGKADWVIVIDMDELIYSVDIYRLLSETSGTIFSPTGFNMLSDEFPNADRLITEQVKFGVEDKNYGKLVMFTPHKIIEIHYLPGAHEAFPEGIVKEDHNLQLLHYKNLGIDYVLARISEYQQRMSDFNKQMGHGFHYDKTKEVIESDFRELKQKAIQVIK